MAIAMALVACECISFEVNDDPVTPVLEPDLTEDSCDDTCMCALRAKCTE